MNLKGYWETLKKENPYLFYLRAKNKCRLNKRRLKKYSDLEAINRSYFRYSGSYPNLENPETFSEKIQWLKLNYKDEKMAICADKYAVRRYLTDKGYAHLLAKKLAVYEEVEDIDLKALPKRFVMKMTHGSGWNLIVADKNKVDWFIWKKIMKVWLHDNYFGMTREWVYKDIKPRILVEEYLEDDSGGLMDYKFFCFRGKVHFLQMDIDRYSDHHVQGFYDLDWNVLAYAKNLAPKEGRKVTFKHPERFDKMIALAEELSQPFPFVRIDFYDVKGEVIFGEMTFYPKGGLPYFRPGKYDKIFGDLLKIDNLV